MKIVSLGLCMVAQLLLTSPTLAGTCVGQASAILTALEFEITNCKVEKLGKNNFRVDLRKLVTDEETRNKHMRDNYLEVKKWPYAYFTLDKKPSKPGSFSGTMKIRGRQKKISGKFDGKKYKFKIDITDYGIEKVGYGSITIGQLIDFTVTL